MPGIGYTGDSVSADGLIARRKETTAASTADGVEFLPSLPSRPD